MPEVEDLWNKLIDENIATEAELQLVTSINGYTVKALTDVLFVRTGYRSWE